MKYIICFLILMVASSSLAEVREWTRIDGKKVEAEMVAKTEKTVTIAVKGKHHEVWLTDLIEEDREFVKNNVPKQPKIRPTFRCRTIAKTSYIRGKKNSSAKIEVALKNTKNADLRLFVVWIGEAGDKGDDGVFKTDSKDIKMDGGYQFSVLYDHRPNPRFSKQHKMYAVYLIHQKDHKKELIDEHYSLSTDGFKRMAKQELAKHLEG